LSRRLALAAVLMLLPSVPTLGAEVIETSFQASFRYAGADLVLDTTTVPLLADNACYDWYIRLAEGTTAAAGTERRQLPEPIDWGALVDDDTDNLDISEDGAAVTATFEPDIDDDGWIKGGWCVVEGDPLGEHTIEVALDGEPAHTFAFTIVAPAEYDWPATTQPEPRARSVDKSW
jgi:hypothetical protein